MSHETSPGQRSTSNGFARSGIAQFLSGPAGRGVRVVAGLALIAVGLGPVGGGMTGYIIAIVGLVPIAAGAFDFCLLGPLFKAPFRGADIRAAGRSDD